MDGSFCKCVEITQLSKSKHFGEDIKAAVIASSFGYIGTLRLFSVGGARNWPDAL